MPIPDNITKEHLLKAIEKIDTEGYDYHAESSFYDVVHNGKRYPPKLIISLANIFANGETLDRNTFEGGIGTDCFKLLEKNGFIIQNKPGKENTEPKVWFVTQGATYTPERGKQFLFAPSTGKDGKSRLYWDNLLKVKKGDIIFNYSEGLRGISIAKSNGYSAKNTDPNSIWASEGFRVDLDLVDLQPPISKDQLVSHKGELNRYLASVRNKPFNNVGGVNQGYLYEFTKEAGRFLRDLHGKKFGNQIIDDFFDKVLLRQPREDIESSIEFTYDEFYRDTTSANFFINKSLTLRFIASLLTKPFVILTGLSGSGKTKLAQAFAKWICEDEGQYCLVPVGADWINREPLLGYPNSLDVSSYLMPDNGVLDLIIKASNENQNKPYFLILDEMNLSHVERYFADFLSVMESRDSKGILLHSDNGRKDTNGKIVPNRITLPSNLFIIGTVNIDETTYMFSPKVLDRANVIEFRITKDEMKKFFEVNEKVRLESLEGLGASMASSFISLAMDKNLKIDSDETAKEIGQTLLSFFNELKKIGAEFGYRSASEILRFGAIVNTLEPNWKTEDIIDGAIMQKLLPKLHGSRSKLSKLLITLGKLCIEGDKDVKRQIFDKHDEIDFETEPDMSYRISLEKISRMHKNVIEHGFTSYAEA